MPTVYDYEWYSLIDGFTFSIPNEHDNDASKRAIIRLSAVRILK